MGELDRLRLLSAAVGGKMVRGVWTGVGRPLDAATPDRGDSAGRREEMRSKASSEMTPFSRRDSSSW